MSHSIVPLYKLKRTIWVKVNKRDIWANCNYFKNLFFRYIFWPLHFNILSFILFFAGSVSSPVIELTNVKNEMVLECKSNGWYPEPQMLWVYSEEKPISVEPTKNVRGSDGLYTVSSKVTVEKGQSYSFTCKVQQKNISQIKEAHIHVSGRNAFFLYHLH